MSHTECRFLGTRGDSRYLLQHGAYETRKTHDTHLHNTINQMSAAEITNVNSQVCYR